MEDLEDSEAVSGIAKRGDTELMGNLGTTDFAGAAGGSAVVVVGVIPILRGGTGDLLDLEAELSSAVDVRRIDTGGECWSFEGIRSNGMDFRCSVVSD
jgi:hypothetical protein